MKKLLTFIRKKLLVPTLVSLFTLVGGYTVQQIVLTKAKPVLKRDVFRTDLSGLPPEVQRQIPLIPLNYSLQNTSRAPAQNVTIFVKSDSLINISDLKFSQESEDHQFSLPDPHEFKINVPTIRPSALVSFQIITAVSNNITFTELSDNAQIVTPKGVAAQKEKSSLVELGIFALLGLVWLPVLAILIYVFVNVGKSWRDIETTTPQPEIKRKLIVLIVALYIYDDLIVSSFGTLQAFLPVPRIRFEELISAFAFYFLITRYKLIDSWLLSKTGTLDKDKPEK